MPVNPYTPGAGRRPEALVGREIQIALVGAAADQFEAGYEAESIVFHGLRGMGKTVFLKEVAELLRARGWLCGYHSVRHGTTVSLAVAQIISGAVPLVPAGSRFARSVGKLSGRIGAVTLTAHAGGPSLTVAAEPVTADLFDDLVKVLRRLGELAREAGTGVALLVDEMQELRRDEMAALVDATGSVAPLPVLLIGAGLPYLPTELSAACTWAERLRYESLGRLGSGAARRAVVEPAARFGVTYSEEALHLLLSEADGYPFFLQLYANETWRAAGTPSDAPGTEIGLDEVASAVPEVKRILADGIYSARYGRASEKERGYLEAMARLQAQGATAPTGGPGQAVRSGEVAKALQRDLSSLSPIRDSLIKKGLVHSPATGLLEFSVPGFGTYVLFRATEA